MIRSINSHCGILVQAREEILIEEIRITIGGNIRDVGYRAITAAQGEQTLKKYMKTCKIHAIKQQAFPVFISERYRKAVF